MTPLCPWCGQEDSLRHRHWQCAYTAPSRSQLSADTIDFLEAQPECLTIRGWPLWPDDLDQLRHCLARLPDLSAQTLFDPASWDGSQFELFTDGAADQTACPYTRIAACGQSSRSIFGLARGRARLCTCIWQTVVRAELWALVASPHACGRIWIDNQEVYLKARRAFQGDLDISPTMADSDLRQAVLTVVPQLACPPVALKVVSHIGRGQQPRNL